MPGKPSSIETAYVNQFREGFDQAFQQAESIFDPLVERETQSSEFEYFDRIGEAEDMQEDNTRYGDNPTSEIPHDRRRIGLRDFELGKYIDEKDLMRVITDPMNPYSQAMLNSGRRKRDDFVIDRYFGSSWTGKKGDTEVKYAVDDNSGDDTTVVVGEISNGSSNPITGSSSRYTLKSGDYEGISVGVGFNIDGSTTETGMTLDKLKAIRSAMLRVEAITQDTQLNCVMTHRQFEDLLGIDEVINADYAVRKALAEGSTTTFMGFRFINSERVPKVNDERRVMVFLPRAFKLTVADNLRGDIWRDPSKKQAPYMYFRQTIGGSRMWGEIAGEIRCLES